MATRQRHPTEQAKPRGAGVVDALSEVDAHIGYLLDRGRRLTLRCWQCKRRTVLTPEQLRAGATRGPEETIWRFALRCRCDGCGARGPAYGYEGEPRRLQHGRIYTRQGTIRPGFG